VSSYSDTIEVRSIVRALQRGWREIIVFTLLGTLAALAVVVWAPRKFDGSASAIVQSSDPQSGLLSRIAGGRGGGGGGGGLATGILGVGQSSLETEIKIMESRAVAAVVVDSLRLQARVRSPASTPSTTIVRNVSLPGSFRRLRLTFDGAAGGTDYQVSGTNFTGRVSPGGSLKVATGSITLATELPPRFELELLDHEDATDQFAKRLVVSKAGGDVVRVTYRANDSLTAPRAANLVLATYLSRRKTSDRGVNQYKAEAVSAKIDSVSKQLAAAENQLRREREASGVIDPEVVAKIGLERASEIRSQLTTIGVESGAINKLLGEVASGTMSVRQLAAYPAFIRSSAISELVSQLSRLETERTKLLATRTELDPEVQAIEQSMTVVEGQLKPLAVAYSSTLDRQRIDLKSELDTIQTALGTMPRVAIESGRLEREVLNLSTTYAGLQTMLVEAKLAAIGEGGDVRQLDVAEAPKKPSFPKPATTIAAGLAGGVFVGMFAALMMALMGRWVRDTADVERLAGAPAVMLGDREPLMVGGPAHTVLIIPLNASARAAPVAQRLAATASSRNMRPTVFDLSDPESGAALDVNATIGRLESEHGMVIVQLPNLTDERTVAALHESRPVLLVAPPGRVERAGLVGAVQMLKRLDVSVAGVVLSGEERRVLARGTRDDGRRTPVRS
jgi:tyrosine-protein kinase Etk/Wzc